MKHATGAQVLTYSKVQKVTEGRRQTGKFVVAQPKPVYNQCTKHRNNNTMPNPKQRQLQQSRGK